MHSWLVSATFYRYLPPAKCLLSSTGTTRRFFAKLIGAQKFYFTFSLDVLEVLRPVIRGRRGPNARGQGGELLTNSYSSPLSTLHCTELHRTVHCTVFNESHCTVQGSACLKWNDEVVV